MHFIEKFARPRNIFIAAALLASALFAPLTRNFRAAENKIDASGGKLLARRVSPAAFDADVIKSARGEVRFILVGDGVQAEFTQPSCEDNGADGPPNDCPDIKFAFPALRYDKDTREIFLGKRVVAERREGGGFIWNYRPSGFVLSKGFRLGYEWVPGGGAASVLQVFLEYAPPAGA
ncbi:MAG: hypothetical protein HKL90_08915 [Elusimicrobia bacterium]|nr:hypothetical protein [Elusimicrobiota bacterium]